MQCFGGAGACAWLARVGLGAGPACGNTWLCWHGVPTHALLVSWLASPALASRAPTHPPAAAAASRRPGDLRSSMSSIQMSQAALAAQLHALLMSFLRSAVGGAGGCL